MTEREQAHSQSSATEDKQEDDRAPGRVSRSALMRKLDRSVASGLIQRKERDANGVAAGADDAVAAASSSSGSPLPATLQRKFESSLGADLSSVRVHTGETSAAANEAVGAKAYTVGNDIHFGAGQYDPSSPAGEHLLAHEVAHTVQQNGGAARKVMQFKLAVSSPGDSLEHEADHAADAMVAGQSATVSGGGGVHRMIQREAAGAHPIHKEKKHTISIKDLPLTDKPLGPLHIEPKLSLEAEVAIERGEPPASGKSELGLGKKEEKGKEEGGTKAAAGAVGGDGKGAGVQAEIEHKFKTKFLGWQPSVKSEGALTSKGLDISAAIALTHEWGPIEVERAPFKITILKWEAGKDPVIAAFSPTAKVKATALNYTTSDGTTATLSFTGGFALETGITVGSFLKWVGERYGQSFLATLAQHGLAGLAGGIADLAVALSGAGLAISVGAVSVVAAAQSAEKGKRDAAILAGASDTKRAALAYTTIMSGSENTENVFPGVDAMTPAVAGPRQLAAEKRAHADFENLAALRGITVEQLRKEMKEDKNAFGRIWAEAKSTGYPAYLKDARAAIHAWHANPAHVDTYFVTEAMDTQVAEKNVLAIYNDGKL